MSFVNADTLSRISWQAFERLIARLLIHQGYTGVRLVGAAFDGGADVLAHRGGKRWLFQAKRWNARVGNATVDRTLEAMQLYRAAIPVIVSPAGFEQPVRDRLRSLHLSGAPLQLWDRAELLRIGARLIADPPIVRLHVDDRPYQQRAVVRVVGRLISKAPNGALVVMATGLGKTFVAAESIRRYRVNRAARVLALAHTNALVDQLERAFWPFLSATDSTLQWNGLERVTSRDVNTATLVFGCTPTVLDALRRNEAIEPFDIVIVDECHHGAALSYTEIFERLGCAKESGPFLLGLTATPWHQSERSLSDIFGDPIVTVDIVTGLRNGFLANVDYRLYTDNINWDGLKELRGERISPRSINRTFFLPQWDDGVALELRKVFDETANARAIVFCSTVEHAITMRDRLNALRFCSAAAIYSGSAPGAPRLRPFERNRLLCDFQDNVINCICSVDIFNEGIDVPDVNVIVFQRVTHSRRIFVQQLGRGLRLAPGKETVVVLDFVSDIRRFAAGLALKDSIHGRPMPRGSVITLPHRVTFRQAGRDDERAETFLREWLHDVAAVESAGDDANVLRYPPPLLGTI